MTGGLIQLVAQGIHDIFLTRDPQITFFKVVYRRHTNFSIQAIKQPFAQTPDFGKKTTCTISRNGDLINKCLLVVTLPKINQFITNNAVDNITKFAWVRKLAFALIKTIDVEIGGQLIERHYGEWLNIWAELTTDKTAQYNRMIGNVEELFTFTNGKDPYTLYIPLSFWFSRTAGMALPLIALHFSEVKINIEINDLANCSLITPTHYVNIENDLAPFQPYEYIEQNINGVIAAGMFTYYDMLTKRLYFSRISRNQFQSLTVPNEDTLTPSQRRAIIYQNPKYWIVGLTSGANVMPLFNNITQSYTYTQLRNVSLTDCYLLIDYIFLDEDERQKFVNTRHDYLIEQLIYSGESTLTSANQSINMDFVQPSKFIVWIAQFSYLLENYNNDIFNYTNSYKYSNNKQIGTKIPNNETIILNSQNRISLRNSNYFNCLQPYQHFSYGPQEGINVYSFAILPEQNIASGACNMSQIDNIGITVQLDYGVNTTNTVKFRAYSFCINIFRVINGLGGVVFTR